MSSSNRHPERGVRENTLTRREHESSAFSPTTKAIHHSNHHARVLKELEQTSKIGRRFSFDDNGGGYQGL